MVLALIVSAPMSQLLRPGLSPHVDDWTNALWAIGYTGRWIADHGVPPVVLSPTHLVGDPVPVFYAPILFPMLGSLSILTGVGVAVRLGCVVAWAIQASLVYRLFRAVRGSAVQGFAAAAMVSWSVYPLTNLYHRGALAEFFGTTFLLSAAAAGGLALVHPSRQWRVALGLLCGLLGALAAGSHAITAIVGGLLLAALLPAALRLRPLARSLARPGAARPGAAAVPLSDRERHQVIRRRTWNLALLGLFVAVSLSPWLYASARFGSRLFVSGLVNRLIFIPEYDALAKRLAPLPDGSPNSDLLSVGFVATPYLEAPLSLPLLLTAAWTSVAAWRSGFSRRARTSSAPASPFEAIIRMSWLLFGGLLLISSSRVVSSQVPAAAAGVIQYAYRFVTYLNLTLLIALAAALGISQQRSSERRTGAPLGRGWPRPPGRSARVSSCVWGIATVLAAAALITKLVHAGRTLAPATAEAQWAAAPDSFAQLPRTYYARQDYAIVDDDQKFYHLPTTEWGGIRLIDRPAAGDGRPFGSVTDIPYEEAKGGWVVTDVLSFPWNRLTIDGRLVAATETRVAPNSRLAVKVPAGTHSIGYALIADRLWAGLRVVSCVALVGWGLMTGGVAGRAASGVGSVDGPSNP